MARKRYIETHSNYTLRKVHQVTSKGTVFESDLMTITEPGAFAPGQMPIFADSNFKMSVRRGRIQKLKHENGAWLVNNNCETAGTIWTNDCLDSASTTSSSYKIRPRPDYTDMRDFACYGSASELVRASITDIIKNFPGELYLTNEKYLYFVNGDSNDHYLGEEDSASTWYIVENPFNINVHNATMPTDSLVPEIRYFCESFTKYIFIPDQVKDMLSYITWGVVDNNVICPVNGQCLMTIYLGSCELRYYYINGEKILMHNFRYGTAHIRPNEAYLTEFYNSLDEFEYGLLNRATNNTITLQTPEERENGIFVTLRKYQWPTIHGWNLDTESSNYAGYLSKLSNIAEFYDTFYTDNIIRSMTHEAIKNFDWTYKKPLDGETEGELTDPNPYRAESILRIYGRVFDDIKLHARTIKNTNSVSYGGVNDTPDYFLTDELEMAGWEVKNPLSGNSNIITPSLYPGVYRGYTIDDANNEFMRVLKLNSKAIFNAKGTKRGLEMVLALFGFHSMDYFLKRTYSSGRTWNDLTAEEQNNYIAQSYSMDEVVGVATDTLSGGVGYSRCDNSTVRKINAYRDGFHLPADSQSTLDDIELQGLPVKPIHLVKEVSGETQEYTYLVPWYDKDGSYNTYFQGKGGWGRTNMMKCDIATYGEMELITDSGYSVYEETQKYLHFAEKLTDLTTGAYVSFAEEDIYYVEDISDFDDMYVGIITNPSHYFVLKNRDSSDVLGYDDEAGVYGWVNVTEDDIENLSTVDAKRVVYLESISNNNKGNNPHMGYGLYDNGDDYLENLAQLFTGYTFTNVSDTKISGYQNIGFDIEKQIDNIKCWYFTDTTLPAGNLICLVDNEDGETYSPYYDISGECDTIMVGEDLDDRLRGTDLEPYNMEGTGIINDEAAANSIINLKNFNISFYPNAKLGFSQYDFIKDVVLFYAKQLIPSTAILSYYIPDIQLSKECGTSADLQGVASDNWQTSDPVVYTTTPYVTAIVTENTNSGAAITLTSNAVWSTAIQSTDTIPGTDTSEGVTPREIETGSYIAIVKSAYTVTSGAVTTSVEFETNNSWSSNSLNDVSAITEIDDIALAIDGENHSGKASANIPSSEIDDDERIS